MAGAMNVTSNSLAKPDARGVNGDGAAPGVIASADGKAFETLLSVLHRTNIESIGLSADASASLVFEAPPRQGDRPDRGTPDQDRRLSFDASGDRGSVGARLAARNAAAGGSQRSPARPDAAGAPGRKSGQADAVRGSGQAARHEDASRRSDAQGARSASASGRVTERAVSLAKGSKPAGVLGQAALQTDSAAPASAPALTATKGMIAEGMARLVGQILGAARSGDGALLRVTVPASSVTASDGSPVGSRGSSTPGAGKPAATSTPSQPDETQSSAFERLVRAIRLQGGPRASSAQIQLDPPKLGRISVDVRLNGSELHLTIRTQFPDTRDLLFERVAELRASLEQHGLRVAKFDVSADLPGDQADGFAEMERNDHGEGAWRRDASPDAERRLEPVSLNAMDDRDVPAPDSDIEADAVASLRLDVRA